MYGYFKEWCNDLIQRLFVANSNTPVEPDTIRSWDRKPDVLFDETEYHLQSMLKFMESADTSNYLLDFIDLTRALDETRDPGYKRLLSCDV